MRVSSDQTVAMSLCANGLKLCLLRSEESWVKTSKQFKFGWPLGMPLVKHLEGGIWEIRIKLENRIARILFCLEGSTMVILHGFIKKQQATPKQDLDLAKDRLKILKRK